MKEVSSADCFFFFSRIGERCGRGLKGGCGPGVGGFWLLINLGS